MKPYEFLYVLCIVLCVGLIVSAAPSYAVGAPMMKTKEATLLNVELEGSKIWLPGMLVLKRGEEVKLKLINKHKDPHGVAVDELRLQAVVDGGATKEVVVKPARAGTFRLYCHLHPAHIGGQVIVNP
ncbi:MAG: cupredoxin domain-containing protein [bacterium]